MWGNDLVRAARIASQIEAGSEYRVYLSRSRMLTFFLALDVWVNEIHQFGPTIPGGGHKSSGVGVENGVAGLAGWTNLQTISVNNAAITPP